MRYKEYEFDKEEEAELRWGGDGDVRVMRRHKTRARGSGFARTSTRAPKRRSPLEHIRAQSRCVVHPDLPISAYSDTIPWEALLRVVTGPIDCPICISTSTVPRMLECGHVMCLPCFFRFWRHSPEHFCPVCGDHVSGSLLPVSFLEADPLFMPRAGAESVLRLMKTQPGGSGLADEPEAVAEARKPKPDMILYSRVVCATLAYLRQELVAERDTLEREQSEALQEYGDDEGYPEALDTVRKSLHAKLEPLARAGGGDPATDRTGPDRAASAASAPLLYYQTAFESPVTYVLSHLDVSLLKSAFGDFENFPPALVPKVENIIYTSFEQDPTLRKWFRYLSYLPDTAPLAVLECDWRSVLPPEALQKYSKALNQRRHKTISKKVREEESRVRAQSEQDALFRLAAADETPLPLDQLEIDTKTLPTLGGAAPKKAAPKIWNKNSADMQEVQQLLSGARQVKGKKGKVRLVIQ